MIRITNDIYRKMACEVSKLFQETLFFSGNVELDSDEGDYYAKLVLTAMRKGDEIIPVWWEFHTYLPEGEVLNDFQFDELFKYMILK